MNRVFGDTAYFIGLLSAADALHEMAVEYAEIIEKDATLELVSTDAILVEVLNGASRHGQAAREAAVALVRLLQSGARIEPQTRELLTDAVALYADRPDKDWSVTDCMSILVMERLEIEEALSPDRCFEQAGKKAIMAGRT